jgi:hypothetical protein
MMFVASQPFTLFDYFRVPYRLHPTTDDSVSVRPWFADVAVPNPDGAERRLYWPILDRCPAGARPIVTCDLGGISIVGRVATDEEVARWLPDVGPEWFPAEKLMDVTGRGGASVWRSRSGDALLPFDPGEVMHLLWSEGYLQAERSQTAIAARALALRCYYVVRPVVPRPVQIGLRRAFTRVQSRSSFPRWPIEDSLHNLYGWLFDILAGLAGRPVPSISLWPDGKSWALVLTHDVETADGLQKVELLRACERVLGYHSSWNLVGERYPVDDTRVRRLRDDGCEIGVHGLRHDGRDLASARALARRLPEMRRWAERWDAVGFRSPATQRRWEWMPQLGFRYDSSYTDTDPFEPQPGGCCSYLPFLNDGMVELPITLPQDHTLFVILGQQDGEVWLRKARHIRGRHGMVLALAHPDYAEDPRLARAWRTLLEEFRGDHTMWHALPREVADWWNRRAESCLSAHGTGWRVVGPAAPDGRVTYTFPRSATAGHR